MRASIKTRQAIKKLLDINGELTGMKTRNTTPSTLSKMDITDRGIADMIFDLSQEYVPVKTGLLKGSGHVRDNKDGSFLIAYETGYARYVHEIVENHHEMPTRSKFLEDAGYEILNQLEQSGITFEMLLEIDEDGVGLTVYNIKSIGR